MLRRGQNDRSKKAPMTKRIVNLPGWQIKHKLNTAGRDRLLYLSQVGLLNQPLKIIQIGRLLATTTTTVANTGCHRLTAPNLSRRESPFRTFGAQTWVGSWPTATWSCGLCRRLRRISARATGLGQAGMRVFLATSTGRAQQQILERRNRQQERKR
jgi:hypothetical protein